MAELQRELDTIRTDMVKTGHLEVWSQDMEGAINPVLSILDELMKNWRCVEEFQPILRTTRHPQMYLH